jgi:hypothetical protein
MFALGMPKKIKESPDLLRVHQELAGVMYGTLTKEALRERVMALIKGLTSPSKGTIMKKKRPRSAWKTWGGRKPSG